MAAVITDEMIETLGILAKLELSEKERETAKKDLAQMLAYIDQLNELDTAAVAPLTHTLPAWNVFREDVVTNGDGRADALGQAPQSKDGGFVVPKTIES